ncbi:MAG: alpha/beta hydrolase [Mogibacterium sp.]|nr:alpha/beta hydrolase [Mogibacterium sp.]
MNIKIDGYDINYKITGPDGSKDAPVLVVLQGWGTELGMYDSVASAVNDRYRVVQLDFPGFGASDEPREPWNVDAYADFVCSFMQQLGIKKAVLLGHSYGGRVIIKLAARDSLPFEIEKIILVDSAGVMPERSASQKFRVRMYKIKRTFLTSKPVHAMFPEVIDYWMSKQGSEDYRNASPMMKKCLVMAVNEDLQHLMPEVQQEVLLVWGDLDVDTPISDARRMEQLMPNAGLAVLEGTDHFSFLYKPVEFRNILRTFLGIGGAS